MGLLCERNINDLFSKEEDIDAIAMSFFSVIGHTCASTSLYFDNDPVHFAYVTLATKEVLSQFDRATLLLMKTISLLFIMDSSIFNSKKNNTIYYFAVDLSVQKGDRSLTASKIQLLIARMVKANTVILFRNEEACMLSFSLTNSDRKDSVVLSDWFSAGSHDELFFESLSAYNFSFASANAFYSDFCQAAARQYYSYPCSYEFVRYELVPAVLGNYEERDFFTYVDIADMVRSVLFEPMRLYGDDYIDDDYLYDELPSDYLTEDLEDIDFDLLEYELEQKGAFNSKFQCMPSDGEIELISQSSYIQESKLDSSLIPSEVMLDPVKLLAWLEEHENEPDNNVEAKTTFSDTIRLEDVN